MLKPLRFNLITLTLMLISYQSIAEQTIGVELLPLTDQQKKIGKYHKKPDSFSNLEINFDGIKYKKVIWTDQNVISVPFAKVVMCGKKIYPAVVIRNLYEDSVNGYSYSDDLLIFNELLNKLNDTSESFFVSKFQPSPDISKFSVDLQPKFTLENVEAFVCSSQLSLCDSDQKLENQCTFDNGKQASLCAKDGDINLKVGKSPTDLSIDFHLIRGGDHGYGYTFNKYETEETIEGSKGKFQQGVRKSLSFFNEEGTDYAFENHWRASSLKDYDFHAEFNIRQNGVIVESHRCLEGSYE